MDELSEYEENVIPDDILDDAKLLNMSLLPEKSRFRYEKEYDILLNWMREKRVKKISEEVILAYFLKLSNTFQPPTLWSKYSMLRSPILIKEDIDIKYPKLIAFLKKLGAGYKAKKAVVFSREEINKFIFEAPDDQYLMMKVALIIAICGACRCDELCNMTVEDIQDKGDIILIVLPDTKTKIQREFIVTNNTIGNVNILDIIKKYAALRPAKTDHRRFFLSYRKSKCSLQVVGKNTMSKIPFFIAKYLNLHNPEQYTGHSLRRTSASLLANAGGDILTLKKHGGWRSTSVAEGYVDQSTVKKCQIANQIMTGTQPLSNITKDNITENATTTEATPSSTIYPSTISFNCNTNNILTEFSSPISFSNVTNCTFNFFNKS